MYLTQDMTGPASGRRYGLKGDRVTVIKDFDQDFKVVENNGEKFIVANDHLSYDKIQKDSPAPEAVKKGSGRIQPLRKVKRSR